MNFIAIDFETANSARTSACSIGLIFVQDGTIIDKKYFLIKPVPYYFDPFNVSIHGITKNDVKEAPHFNELWPTLKEFFQNKLIIAHNASFDMSVLRYVLDHYNIEFPHFDYSCTLIMAKKIWKGLYSYTLPLVAEQCGIVFNHHNALEDAKACALIAIQACEKNKVRSLYDLSDKIEIKVGKIFPGGYKPASIKKAKGLK